MRYRPYSVFISLALLLAAYAASAQTTGKAASGSKIVAEPKPSSFSRLFRNPTNNNGYEEWVQAADLIQNNPELEALSLPDATLAQKRRLLAEPSVAQALLLIRQGLTKPVLSPHENFDETTVLPELVQFRALARLLRVEQYVAFAEGHVEAAIESLRVGLAFGYRIQTDSLISGVVGLSVDNIVLDEFARHLDQLSVFQCTQVYNIARDFLNAENPAIRLLTLEKGYAHKMLETRRSDPKALLTLLDMIDIKKHPEDTMDVLTVQAFLNSPAGNPNAALDDAEARISAVYDHALLNLRLPLAQRTPFVRDTTVSPAAALCRLFAVDAQKVQDRYTGDQAKLRLLGAHALIHRYRWEHNALPSALGELHADELVKDPFTGNAIVYQRDGDRYTLYSQGPFKQDETSRETTKERVPVKLAL